MKGTVVQILAAGYGGPGTGVLVGGYLFVRRDGEVMVWDTTKNGFPASTLQPVDGKRVSVNEAVLEAARQRLAADSRLQAFGADEVFDEAEAADAAEAESNSNQ